MGCMPVVSVDDRKIYYEETGKGPALLLVRGLARSLRFWAPLVRELENEFRLITFDHRGIGRSSAGNGSFYSTAELAHDAVRVLDAVGVARAHVFGLSMGGMVAMRLAIEHGNRVNRLVLGATRAGGKGAPRPRVTSFLCIAGCGFLPRRRAVRQSARWIVSPEFLRRSPQATDEWERWLAADSTAASTLVRQARAAWTHDVADRLCEITAPTLVITGDADRIVPPANSDRLVAAIGGAQMEVLPGVGHDFPAEAPSRTAALVREHCGVT